MLPIPPVIGVYKPRVVDRRLSRTEQERGNNAIAEQKAARLSRKLSGGGAEKTRAGFAIKPDTPELLQAISDARRALASQPWWKDAGEVMQEGLLEALEALYRGKLSQGEWTRYIAEVQAVLRGHEPSAASFYRTQNVDMYRLPGGW